MKSNVDGLWKESVEEMESVDLIQNCSYCIPYTDTPVKTVSTQSIQKSEGVLDSRVAGAVMNDGCLSIHQILPDPEEVTEFLVLQKSDFILGVKIPSARYCCQNVQHTMSPETLRTVYAPLELC